MVRVAPRRTSTIDAAPVAPCRPALSRCHGRRGRRLQRRRAGALRRGGRGRSLARPVHPRRSTAASLRRRPGRHALSNAARPRRADLANDVKEAVPGAVTEGREGGNKVVISGVQHGAVADNCRITPPPAREEPVARNAAAIRALSVPGLSILIWKRQLEETFVQKMNHGQRPKTRTLRAPSFSIVSRRSRALTAALCLPRIAPACPRPAFCANLCNKTGQAVLNQHMCFSRSQGRIGGIIGEIDFANLIEQPRVKVSGGQRRCFRRRCERPSRLYCPKSL